MQKDVVTHETDVSTFACVGEVLGLATTDQAVPFQFSASAWSCEPLLLEPVAMQKDDVTQDTPLRLLSDEPTFGEGTIDQLLGTTTLDARLCGAGGGGAGTAAPPVPPGEPLGWKTGEPEPAPDVAPVAPATAGKATAVATVSTNDTTSSAMDRLMC